MPICLFCQQLDRNALTRQSLASSEMGKGLNRQLHDRLVTKGLHSRENVHPSGGRGADPICCSVRSAKMGEPDMKCIRGIAVAALTIISLSSCASEQQIAARIEPVESSSPSSRPDMPIQIETSESGIKAAVHAGQSSVPQDSGQLDGLISLDESKCLILRAPDGDTTTLVFPEGTTFSGEALTLPSGLALADGDTVLLQGARVPANEDLSMCINYHRLFSVESAVAHD